ncbi:Ig domain-containing protein [Bacillus norwichensis]|uniref:Ig domain-containing protein n=1 Tax=Bacillus norwichensis TaxID=2762217 RepID=A0ABR8VNS3_9BACI|nr:Ig domain-containing protein [Bacillus norwichensis]MBD8006421.1 Ig domain-containing protein [Bacillus norwichensis]
MNPFAINEQDIQYLFESAGTEVLINDNPHKAIITNSGFNSENDERYINTLNPIRMGDLVTFNDHQYIIITESTSKRYAKYRAIMRHCNFTIQFPGEIERVPVLDEDGNPVLDKYGRPIYEDIEGDPIFIPAIVDDKYFQVNNQFQMRVADNQIMVIVQDNELNRDKFEVNERFELMGKEWKVLQDDLTKVGMLILTCERVV